MRFSKKNQGFSLVELLGVVSIIGILAAVVLFNVQAGKEKARDTQRLTELQQLEIALRVYKDVNGEYPERGCDLDDQLPWSTQWASAGPCTEDWCFSCEEYIEGLAPDYIHELPKDPKSEYEPNRGFVYTVTKDHQDYKVMVEQTVERNGPINRIGVDEYALLSECGTQYLRCSSAACVIPADKLDHYRLRNNTYAIYSSGIGAQCW